MSCEFDTNNNFVTTIFEQEQLLATDTTMVEYIALVRDDMDRCEQFLDLPCLVNGMGVNQGQLSGYSYAEGHWIGVDGETVNFVYQNSINGTLSSCWMYPGDCQITDSR